MVQDYANTRLLLVQQDFQIGTQLPQIRGYRHVLKCQYYIRAVKLRITYLWWSGPPPEVTTSPPITFGRKFVR